MNYRPEDLLEAAEVLRSASRVVVFSGAGASAESGIATFRDQDGLWSSFPPEQFLKGNDIRPHRLRFEELKQYAENEGNIPIYTVALHSRLCQPFAGLVLFTMGLPLLVGFQTLSRSHFISTGLCVLVAGGFYLLTFTCQNLGNSGVLDPVWSAWLPTVLCAAVGLLLTDSMHT